MTIRSLAPEVIRWRAALLDRLKACKEETYPLDPIERDLILTGSATPAIASELYKALERLDADPELLSIIGSWNDTLDDSEVLKLLQDWNRTGKMIHEPQ